MTSRHLLTALAVSAAICATSTLFAQDQGAKLPVRYTATATNLDPSVNLSAALVDLLITRWSTDAERTRLAAALRKGGQQELLDVLEDLPRVGTIKTPDTLAYNLRYARRTPGPDGGEQIVLVTDRPISVWEVSSRPRTLDYPFMIIELRLDARGRGEGRINAATKLSVDDRTGNIVVENWTNLPVRLSDVKREGPPTLTD